MSDSEWVEDADGQFVNLGHVVRLRAFEKSDGTWSVLADLHAGAPHSGPNCLVRGLPDREAAQEWCRALLRIVLVSRPA